MRLCKCVAILSLLISLSLQAQEVEEDRGFFFKLGEKVMNLGGYSYLDLHKKLLASEKGLATCLADTTQAKFMLEKKEAELKTYKEGNASQVPETVPESAPAPAAPPTP
ncbi:MAG TPA: hypothetical protein VNJ08_08385 [Bacteriovoracaceae bacterium]|nr:hypothetical protein [Bacteriovoracaceae bacterium]